MTPQEQLCEKMRVEQSAYCLCIARSCSARKYPASCPNTTDLSTKQQSRILNSAASRHGFCAPKRPIYPAFTMLSHEEKPRGCFRDSL